MNAAIIIGLILAAIFAVGVFAWLEHAARNAPLLTDEEQELSDAVTQLRLERAEVYGRLAAMRDRAEAAEKENTLLRLERAQARAQRDLLKRAALGEIGIDEDEHFDTLPVHDAREQP